MGVLRQHEALTASVPARLTALGAALSRLPVGLHVGKMLLLGSLFHLADPVVTMAAGLSVQSPYVRLPATDEVRARWVTLRARWVTLRARWVTLRALAG